MPHNMSWYTRKAGLGVYVGGGEMSKEKGEMSIITGCYF